MNRKGIWAAILLLPLILGVGIGRAADTRGGVSPAIPSQKSPSQKPGPVPAPAVITPNVKIPPCGDEALPGSSPSRVTAGPKDATTLQVSHGIGAVGATIVLRAKLTRSKDGAPVNNHTVGFTVAGKSAGSAKTDLTGEARVQYPVPAQMGNQPISASYRGSVFCAPSSGKNDLGVVKSATKLSMKRLNEHRTLREGEGDSLQGKLFRITDNKGLDGREVSLKLDGKPIGSTATSPEGSFSKQFTMPPPSAGDHKIEASYEGETLYLGTYGTYPFQVLPKIQNAYLTWTGASGKVGQTVTVTARFGLGNPPSAKNAIPGKTIDFRSYRGGAVEYVKILGKAVTDSQGVATLSFKIEDPPDTYKMATQAHVSKFNDYDVKYLSEQKYTVSKAPVTVSVGGPGAAPIGSKVAFTATVRRTTDNGPAAGVKVTMTLDPSDKIGLNATTNESGQATIPITVPYSYGTGPKTLKFTSSESKHYMGGASATKAFTIQPKSN